MAQRNAVRAAQTGYGLSERRSCALVGLRRSTCRYTPRRDPARALRERLHALAAQRRRFGYRRLTVAVAARRSARESQAGLSALPRGRPGGPPAETQALRTGSAGAARGGHANQSALGDGLHVNGHTAAPSRDDRQHLGGELSPAQEEVGRTARAPAPTCRRPRRTRGGQR